MKVVLPIAALLAILIAAAVFGGSNQLPVPFSQGAPAELESAPAPGAAIVTARNAGSPVAFDPFTGWGVADLQHGVADPGPEGPPVAHSHGALPLVEVDPFDRYGVSAPFVPLVRAVTGSWGGSLVTFAEVRARYAPADALPAVGAAPVASDAWWITAPLDAK